MSFDRRDIRPDMDVYTRDNVYLGTILAIHPGPSVLEERVHEAARQSSETNGEMFGPMPTQMIGNQGPRTQSAAARYAVDGDPVELIGYGALTVGKWWGLLGRRTIPMDAVQTVSIERVVLKWKQSELDEAR